MMPPVFQTRAQGKLLLTGEYFVLDGALALAVPVRFGQSLEVSAVPVEKGNGTGHIQWNSKNPDGSSWFEALFELPDLRIKMSSDLKTALTLFKILYACKTRNPDPFAGENAYNILTQNDFPRQWGLGTSSTLIAALARWTGVAPYPVLFETLGGSGYDLACAYAEGPILYRLEGQMPQVEPVAFAPEFRNHLYFVFLEQKQNSREGIAHYRERAPKSPEILEKVSQLTHRFLGAKTLSELDAVIVDHEHLISEALMMPRAKDLYFSDYWGEVKSLGAWGGDFVLVTSHRTEAETRAYFQNKGFETLLNWSEMMPPEQALPAPA